LDLSLKSRDISKRLVPQMEEIFKAIRQENGLAPLKAMTNSHELTRAAQTWAEIRVKSTECSNRMTDSLKPNYRKYGQMIWKRTEDGLAKRLFLDPQSLLTHFGSGLPWSTFNGNRMYSQDQWARTRQFGLGFATEFQQNPP